MHFSEKTVQLSYLFFVIFMTIYIYLIFLQTYTKFKVKFVFIIVPELSNDKENNY